MEASVHFVIYVYREITYSFVLSVIASSGFWFLVGAQSLSTTGSSVILDTLIGNYVLVVCCYIFSFVDLSLLCAGVEELEEPAGERRAGDWPGQIWFGSMSGHGLAADVGRVN